MSDIIFTIAQMGLALVPGESSPDDFAAVMDKLKVAKEQLKEMESSVEEIVTAHIEATGHDLVIGSIRYYVGNKRTIKARDNAAVLQALLLQQFGVEDIALNYMASQPWRYGAIRDAIRPDLFGMLFEVIEEPELKEGKTTKRLQKTDDRFLKGGAGKKQPTLAQD